MKVLVYGSINIDLTFNVDHMAKEGETIKSTRMVKSAGGKGANQSVALAKAGSEVYFAGKAGDGAQWIVELMNGYGVNTEYLKRTGNPNGQAIIQLDKKKQNSIIILSGSNGEITTDEIDEVLTHFDAGDWLVLENEIPHIGYLIDKAYDKDMQICLNPSPFTDDILSLNLNKVDLFIVNETEASALSGMSEDSDYCDMLKTLEEKFPGAEIVLTAGSRGAYGILDGDTSFASSVKVKVADTVGAGDTFLGYYLTYRNEGNDVATSLIDSCFAAALAVSRPGAMQSMPTREEVEEGNL